MFEELAHSDFASLLGLLEIISTTSTSKPCYSGLAYPGRLLFGRLFGMRIVAAERRKQWWLGDLKLIGIAPGTQGGREHAMAKVRQKGAGPGSLPGNKFPQAKTLGNDNNDS